MTTADDRRERLLEAMLDVVGEAGYAGTSIEGVLSRAGLYRQSFYDNFLDKEDCYLQAYDHAVEALEREVGAATAGEGEWRARLRGGLGAVLRFLDQRPDAGRALIVEVHAASPRAVARRDREMERFARFLARGRDAAGDGAEPPSIAPEAIAAGIHSVVHARLAMREDGSYSALLPGFMYIAVLPYFGIEAAAAELQASSA